MNNIVIYLLEVLAIVICLIVEIILYKKNDMFDARIILISILIFMGIFGITYIFERPYINTKKTINIEVGTIDKIDKPKTTYHFMDITNAIKQEGEINFKKTGNYELKYVVNTLIGKYTKKINVNIIDTQKPEIILEGETQIRQPYYIEYSEPGFKAIDNYDGDLTNSINIEKEVINENEYNLIYKIKDTSGNISKQKRKIDIIDDVKPEINLNGGNNIIIALNTDYIEKGAIANDGKDGDLTNKIIIEGNVDTKTEGTYYISYKVKDNSMNEAIKKRIVIVKNEQDIKTPPEDNEDIGIIFLTFDDGPSSNITPEVLNILKEKNVKATFFVINYSDENENIIKREYEEGHTIGIHGYSHDYGTIYESEEAYMENITKLREKIQNTTGYSPVITRFPGGSSNTISKFNPGIMTRLSKVVIDNGYKYFDWNVSAEDAVGAETAGEIYNNVISGLNKSQRNFVLMHDFEKNNAIIEALPKIIDYGEQNGYVFEKITWETPMITHRIFN